MKKIRFPLMLRDGYPVRNLEELKVYFDIEKIYGYLLDGRLAVWLEGRQYYEEAEKIKECLEIDDGLDERLCEIFRVEYLAEYSGQIKMSQRVRADFGLINQEKAGVSNTEGCKEDGGSKVIDTEEEQQLRRNGSYVERDKTLDVEDYWDDWYSTGNDIDEDIELTHNDSLGVQKRDLDIEDYWDDWYSTG